MDILIGVLLGLLPAATAAYAGYALPLDSPPGYRRVSAPARDPETGPVREEVGTSGTPPPGVPTDTTDREV